MTLSLNLRSVNRMRLGVASIAAVGLLVALPGSAQAATAVPLGNADSFAILAGESITNLGGASTITGDIGLAPGELSGITGISDIIQPAGTIHAADEVAAAGKVSLVAAYDNAFGQVPVTTLPSELGQTLTTGVYTSDTFQISGTLTLDAQGDPNAVFIFKAASELNTAVGSNVALINGAQACNVFWQVTSSASLGGGSTFKGTILANTTITLGTGAAVEGRVLASTGSVTLLGNTITRPTCAATPTPTPSPSPTNQVAKVPVGSVSTGNGTSTGPGATPYAVLGALVVAGISGAAAVAVRRRRLNG